jgi:hypothetical protein
MPTALDNGQRSPRKLLRAVIARLLGRKVLAGRARLARHPARREDRMMKARGSSKARFDGAESGKD